MNVVYYYVVGLYENIDKKPVKVYKVTKNYDEALDEYCKYILHPKCALGVYLNNKLISLGKYREQSVDGPGIFDNINSITLNMLNEYNLN